MREIPRVVGMGCVSAVGENVAETWRALLAGKSGIKTVSTFASDGLLTSAAGEIHLSPTLRARATAEAAPSSRLVLFATAAIDEALADADVQIASLKQSGAKVGMVLGTSLGMSLVAPDRWDERLTEFDGDAANDDLGALTEVLEDRYGLDDDVTLVSTACASGTHAIGLAIDMIRYGGYHTVIAGGADSLDRMKYLGHTALSTLTRGILCPYSRHRSGTLFGEGAGILILQSSTMSLSKRSYATCRGAGYSTDINHITAPDPNAVGGIWAIRAALDDAELAPDDIDHVNLHGSGTPLNDSAEYNALSNVFGSRLRRLPCTSIKSAVGHAMGAAGGLEAVATVLSLRDGAVPPTLNSKADDVEFPLDLVTDATRATSIRFAMSNSFGFGGANGVLVFGQ
ncbi:3-oxoacyl-[acyl-carrier-protein] synthase II [Bradyrhizobium sp. USDA 4369]